MRERGRGSRPAGADAVRSALLLLGGGALGAGALTVLHVPAGALIGAVSGAMAVNALADRRRARPTTRRRAPAAHVRALPKPLRVTGQVLLGVVAGSQLTGDTLRLLLGAGVPVLAYVAALLGSTALLARYLFTRHRMDPLTAVMSAAPGGVSELLVSAERRGAELHVVLTIHMFRVLTVVLLVLPVLVVALEAG
ncbi:AbrB family transcriptional regulator [Kocuria sp. M1R5S2]|uniref:AbrB family transcriptional regulator n=1 Tax=Kocuria rhizosphaerae TaxID=3376285 RepID=UPI0037AEB701